MHGYHAAYTGGPWLQVRLRLRAVHMPVTCAVHRITLRVTPQTHASLASTMSVGHLDMVAGGRIPNTGAQS